MNEIQVRIYRRERRRKLKSFAVGFGGVVAASLTGAFMALVMFAAYLAGGGQ